MSATTRAVQSEAASTETTATGGFRISVDVGGTFTDVVITDPGRRLYVGKGSTDKQRYFNGIKEGLTVVAKEMGAPWEELLARADVLIYASTTATNAIIEGRTACTAFLTTQGFPDILVMREGGKLNALDFTEPYPEPYIPRRLTFEIAERITAEGDVLRPLDEDAARKVLRSLPPEVESIAVCLLWSIANPVHEERLAELIEEERPGVFYTVSHRLNPIIREYRRASSTAIDASLKPLIQGHLHELEKDLRSTGFKGELLFAASAGGLMHLGDIAERPVYMVRSGPSLVPVAARHYGEIEAGAVDLIVCDTGGTSFDVGLVRDGNIKSTRETWLGKQFIGHMTGMSSVDVRSIGAGGGSIAWIDSGGLLRVGAQSAGADPGPACYGRGGIEPTVTDAALVLGYLDPDYFAAGTLRLDMSAAEAALEGLSRELGWDLWRTASGILTIVSQHMVQAIREITINEGLDPRESLMVAGGGAAGLNCVLIARELGCRQVLLPKTAGVLSAYGGQLSDIVAEFSVNDKVRTDHFAFDMVNEKLVSLQAQASRFATRLEERGLTGFKTDFSVEARYPHQIWELEVGLEDGTFRGEHDVRRLLEAFHSEHARVFGVARHDQDVECVQWKARLTVPVIGSPPFNRPTAASRNGDATRRSAYFAELGRVEVPIHFGDALAPNTVISGPAIVEEATTTLVVFPGSSATVTGACNYLVDVEPA